MVFDRKYSEDLRRQAVILVQQRRQAQPGNRAVLKEVAAELEIGEQSLRGWVNAADGKLPKKKHVLDTVQSITLSELLGDPQELATLRDQIHQQDGEIARLRRDNETLRRAEVIFASELANH